MKLLTSILLCFIALVSCKTNAYPMEDGSIPQADEENSKMSVDDEPMSWYKPIAVILKPATEKDLRERLNLSTRTTVNHPQPQATSFQQHLPWAYPSPWTPYFFRRNDDVQQQNNWFRNVDECNVDWQSNQRVSYMIGPAKSTPTLYIQRDPYCRHTIIKCVPDADFQSIKECDGEISAQPMAVPKFSVEYLFFT